MNESMLTHAFNKSAACTPKNNPPIIASSTPSISVSDFDVEGFLHHFDDVDMTEEEKHEVLYALWEIMCRFVEIGFGLDSHSLAAKNNAMCEQVTQTTRRDSADLLESQ